MNMQQKVRAAIEKAGNLWPRDKILLKLTEELGELAQAFRKKARLEQIEELGDVAFALLCLAEREAVDFDSAVEMAIEKHLTNPKPSPP